VKSSGDRTPPPDVLLEHLFDGVYFIDHEHRITYWNRAAERISGYPRDIVVGSRCSDNILRHVDSNGHELCIHGCPLAATMHDGELREAEVFLHHRDGHRVPVYVRSAPVYDENGKITGAVEVFAEDSRRTRTRERIRELERAAMLDQLTSIPNRRYGDMRLENLIQNARRERIGFGLVMLDIDLFKEVNDTHGHLVGDEILSMVAHTVHGSIRPLDDVVRWGGEEFIVLLPNATKDSLAAVSERIRFLVEHSWLDAPSGAVRVTVSVGGTLGTGEDDAQSVLGRADEMLYRSKNEGRNRVTVFSG
jgi:diguanylate cyclase (GGDEF)-like protein/PAS domain S-box-containing protein